jgi:hypothetical protein
MMSLILDLTHVSCDLRKWCEEVDWMIVEKVIGRCHQDDQIDEIDDHKKQTQTNPCVSNA